MNWEFHAVNSTDSAALVEEYRQIALLGISFWLAKDREEKEVQPESDWVEKPKGFFAEGPWYSYRTRVYGPGGCLDPAEYDVTVKQTFFPVFDKAVWEREMKKGLRVRKIGRVPIE